MSVKEISENTLTSIGRKSAKSLPIRPSEQGFKPEEIRKAFYDFVIGDNNSILSELKRIITETNESFEDTDKKALENVTKHNSNEEAHADVRALLEDLKKADTQLGNNISDQAKMHAEDKKSLEEKIAEDIETHNNEADAHPTLLKEIASVMSKAVEAYNLASGKSKIVPVSSIDELITILKDGATLDVGTRYITAETLSPDITIFKNNIDIANVSNDVTKIEDGQEVLLEPGKMYFYKNHLLLADESGIDVSALAKQTDFEELSKTVEEKATQTALNELEKIVNTKETAKSIVTETANTIELSSHTEYNCGIRTSLAIALPDKPGNDFEAIVNFYSASTATAFDAPDDIIFTCDDCVNGHLYPITNRLYEISIKSVGELLVAKVGATDYEVIS